jgi:hypothetical protein
MTSKGRGQALYRVRSMRAAVFVRKALDVLTFEELRDGVAPFGITLTR